MQHLDEGTIHAWLDGELPASEAEQVEAHARECAECAQKVAEARGLIAASTRILNALDNVPSGVVPSAATSIAPSRTRRWYDRTELRAAAALLFVAGASLVALRVGRNMKASLQTMAKTESAPLTASIVLDSGSPTIAKAPKSEPQREARKIAAKPPVASSKLSPLRSSGFGSVRAMDEVSSSKIAVAPVVAQSTAVASPLMRLNAADKKAAANEPSALAGAVGGIARSDAAGVGRVEGRVVNSAGSALENVIVTGVSSEPAPRVLKTDSTGTTQRVVYEVSLGVQVTLVDSLTNVTSVKDLTVREKVMATPAPTTAPMAVTTTTHPPINTISWNDGNHHYTLSGPLTARELEAIKPRVMKMRR